MRAAVITAPGTIEITTVDDPAPRAGEVVVDVAATGLCGTDLHILAGEHGTIPVIPGHEVTGTVVAVGTRVEGVGVGDRVAVDPTLPCGTCRFCARGRYNLCESLDALGVTVAGGAAELLAAPAASCVVVPEHVDLRGATLIEPLSCAIHGFDVLHAGVQDASVLVYGAGTIGLLMLAMAVHNGASSVDVVDLAADRLVGARDLGAARTATAADELDTAAWDLVIDCTGSAAAIADGLARVESGGTFLQMGVAPPHASVPISPYDVFQREITITGSKAILHSFARAAELWSTGFVDWRTIITAQRPLAEYADALAAFGRGEGVKTQVLPSA